MCGIVGLFIKDKILEKNLGKLLSEMLITMSDRGPDSAGIAIYSSHRSNKSKLTIQAVDPISDFAFLTDNLEKELGVEFVFKRNSSHAVIEVESIFIERVKEYLKKIDTRIRLMSMGDSIEIYKDVGLPETVASRFKINQMVGSHGIGHTRMATESAVTTLGAHPFNTGLDQCLVHNGSLSNHNSLRRSLIRNGMTFETDNDTEVGAAYLTWKINTGSSLTEALESARDDLDGFYTFVVGTKSGFGVMRDPIGCKPAVMAETDQYVAFGSEYRALVNLPKIDEARVWEPEPATVYFWNH
jgi:amidophosphoribosyltransferase